MDPGAKARLSLEPAQTLVGLDERILGRLVRLIVPTQDAARDAVDVAAVPRDQLREGPLVTRSPAHPSHLRTALRRVGATVVCFVPMSVSVHMSMCNY